MSDAQTKRITGIPPIVAITDLRKWEASREPGWLTAGNGADVIEDLLVAMVTLVDGVRKGHKRVGSSCSCGKAFPAPTKAKATQRWRDHVLTMTGGW